jgi:hypothetical protein
VKNSRRDDRFIPDEGVRQTDDPREPAVRDPVAGVHGEPPRVPRRTVADDARSGDSGEGSTDRLDPDLDTPALRPAVLGRLEGLGLITVVHDAAGDVVDVEGSWRPADETATLDELRETFPVGSVTTFAGVLVEGRHDTPAEDVSMQVVIKRHGEYEDDEGRPLRVVNFLPRDSV